MTLYTYFLVFLVFILGTNIVETTNCVGCFNPIQGVCLLNPDDTCILFTKSQCLAKGKPWQWSNTSLNSWPNGCLSIIEASGFACGGLLPLCPNVNNYLPHATSAKLCGESAKTKGVKILGFNSLGAGDPRSSNCFAIKEFGAGCIWDEWEYFSWNETLQQKKICGTGKVQKIIKTDST